MNDQSLPTSLIDALENCAREGFAKQGRGIVICLEELDGHIGHVVYVPQAEVLQRFIGIMLTPEDFRQHLSNYDPQRSYMVLSFEIVNETEADPTWYEFTYQQPPQVRSA